MKSVKICYSIRDNLGDAINPLIVQHILGYTPVYADAYHCDISGIGSGLGRFFYKPEEYTFKGRAKRDIFRYIYTKPVVLWSAGFISTPTSTMKKTRNIVLPAAVRGNLSRNHIEKLLGETCADCAVGDAGVLAAELLEKPVAKKYALGIVPHDNERGHGVYQKICDTQRNSVIIDVRGNVLERLRLIAQCECIISSSLHGLIIADGMHIPNRQVVLTDKLAGDGFKFADYYSAYGLTPNPINLNRTSLIQLSEIYDSYPVSNRMVEEKKKELCRAFSRYL